MWHAIVRKCEGKTTEIFQGWSPVGFTQWCLVDNSFPAVQLFAGNMEGVARGQMERVEEDDRRAVFQKRQKPHAWKYELRSVETIADLLAP